MKVERLAIPEVILITPPRYGDARGWFMETFQVARYRAAGIAGEFLQDNHSFSAAIGTIRGLHCQVAPSPMGKLVRVLRGAIWDVAVDVRQGSPTYGQHVAAELTAENGAQFWVPAGFLHGFCTTMADTEVAYKCTGEYDRAAERGVLWNDPDLALPWPVAPGQEILSDKDRVLPGFAAAAEWYRV
jgi:dTDP-4-dehydrorhamnose 3,5-epimerase